MTVLTLAVAKGRVCDEALPLLARAGIVPSEEAGRSRRLVLATSRPDVRLVVMRAQDVPTYVGYGAAEAGITGKDVLVEHDDSEFYEPLDLGIARCRMVVAGRDEIRALRPRLRIATKFVRTTRRFFAAKGLQVEIISLSGAMELAPLVGLADGIVDLVDTGKTLAANGLRELEHIMDISSRLIVNKAAMKMNHREIKAFIASLKTAAGGDSR